MSIMAIDTKEFINDVDVGLKANKTFDRFYYRYKIDDKTKRGVLDFHDKEWDKRTRVAKAKAELLDLKNKTVNSGLNFNENSTLNQVAEIYFTIAREQTDWTKELQAVYNTHCKNTIGNKRIKDIRKVLIQSLKPILDYAVENKVLEDISTITVKLPKNKKKIVTNASEKLAALYNAIMEVYNTNPFYRGLFLFALYGRRWNEIATLEWSDIDLLNNTYTIRAENNKIGEEQTYDLPPVILEAINQITDEKIGLVFKSPITGKKLHSPKKPLSKLRNFVDIPELTMHYFRHILVSAMGEMGTAGTVLSASLGHTNLDTVNQFYLSANHTKGSQEANKMIGNIIESN
jgi:integrase